MEANPEVGEGHGAVDAGEALRQQDVDLLTLTLEK
jgi:hypothetical protein